MSRAQLTFTDNGDGTMAIDCRHAGEFDPALQSHHCVRAVAQFLPQILAPFGTCIAADMGIKTAICDGDRYQAMRALALLDDARRQVIRSIIGSTGDPQSETEFDALADKLVEIARGTELQDLNTEK